MRVFSFLGPMQMGGPLNKNRLLEDCRKNVFSSFLLEKKTGTD